MQKTPTTKKEKMKLFEQNSRNVNNEEKIQNYNSQRHPESFLCKSICLSNSRAKSNSFCCRSKTSSSSSPPRKNTQSELLLQQS